MLAHLRRELTVGGRHNGHFAPMLSSPLRPGECVVVDHVRVGQLPIRASHMSRFCRHVGHGPQRSGVEPPSFDGTRRVTCREQQHLASRPGQPQRELVDHDLGPPVHGRRHRHPRRHDQPDAQRFRRCRLVAIPPSQPERRGLRRGGGPITSASSAAVLELQCVCVVDDWVVSRRPYGDVDDGWSWVEVSERLAGRPTISVCRSRIESASSIVIRSRFAPRLTPIATVPSGWSSSPGVTTPSTTRRSFTASACACPSCAARSHSSRRPGPATAVHDVIGCRCAMPAPSTSTTGTRLRAADTAPCST